MKKIKMSKLLKKPNIINVLNEDKLIAPGIKKVR